MDIHSDTREREPLAVARTRRRSFGLLATALVVIALGAAAIWYWGIRDTGSEAPATVAVTGTEGPCTFRAYDTATRMHEYSCVMNASDDRASGTAIVRLTPVGEGFNEVTGSYIVSNDAGTWEGPLEGTWLGPGRNGDWTATLEGTGAFEGLTYVFDVADRGGATQAISGTIEAAP